MHTHTHTQNKRELNSHIGEYHCYDILAQLKAVYGLAVSKIQHVYLYYIIIISYVNNEALHDQFPAPETVCRIQRTDLLLNGKRSILNAHLIRKISFKFSQFLPTTQETSMYLHVFNSTCTIYKCILAGNTCQVGLICVGQCSL